MNSEGKKKKQPKEEEKENLPDPREYKVKELTEVDQSTRKLGEPFQTLSAILTSPTPIVVILDFLGDASSKQ